MRILLFLPLLLTTLVARAELASPQAFERVFELAGIRLLCEQSAPLLLRGAPEARQDELRRSFAAEGLCADLAQRLAKRINLSQVRQAESLLDTPLARRFTEAEREVGESGAQGLADYRQKLTERPPLGARLDLVRRLDKAAQTTALATLLRYEVGKTQALLALKARGETLDEQALGEQTAKQEALLRQSSAQAVESFMLYAYRRMPSDQLADYVELYEQEPLRELLEASVDELRGVFAARRMALK